MSAGCSGLFDFYADLGTLGQGSFCSFDPLTRASIWQGNSVQLFLHILIGGLPVTDMAAATSGRFQLLGHRDNSIGVLFNYPGDPKFLIDDPEVGIIRIILDASVTDLLLGEYDLAVEFVWPTVTYEWAFSKTLNVMRDQILFPNANP